ncbi:HAD family hydrolase [Saccharibacillus kuerlensis]|nr:HAD family hydrolase [Saccharibacillus kuerlensis]
MPYVTVTVGEQAIECEAIVFDKDGTLLDFMELWGRWADDMLKQAEEKLNAVGGDWTGSAEKTFGVKRGPDGRIADYDRSGPLALATAEEMTGLLAWQLYGAGIPWHESVDAVRSFVSAAEEHLERDRPVRPLPGLPRLLQEAREAGIKLAVATSDTTASAVKHLRWAGLDLFFDCITGRDLVQEGKPAPDLTLEACRRIGVETRHTIVIGDGGADMEMARRAGAALCIGIAPIGMPRKHLQSADLIIADYNEVKIMFDDPSD